MLIVMPSYFPPQFRDGVMTIEQFSSHRTNYIFANAIFLKMNKHLLIWLKVTDWGERGQQIRRVKLINLIR